MCHLTEHVGQALRQHRQAAGLSQESLADRAGLHRTAVSLIERGQRSPSVETLQRICAALGIPVSRLLSDAEGLLS